MSGIEDLITRCDRDPEAFRELVENYKMRIYSFLIHLAGRSAADDLFSEVWVKVLKGAPRYVPQGKPASWLFKIANNAALDYLRKQSKERETEELEEKASRLPSREPGPLKELANEELKRRPPFSGIF